MNEMSDEVRQTCEAMPASAASTAAVYFAICCRMASAAALPSALSPGAAHAPVKPAAKHRISTRERAALALLGFFMIDGPGDAELIGHGSETVRPERFLQ